MNENGRAVIVALVTLFIGCGSPKNESSDGGVSDLATSGSITLSGVLNGGSASFKPPSPPSSWGTDSVPSGALAGYQLYCVTFSMPPVAGSGVADASGAVTVTFAAVNTPFGCFVLDPSGGSAATVIFTNGTQAGQTASVGADTSLGTIIVDGTNGVAKATVTTGAIAPATATCPAGTWSVMNGTSACGTSFITMWVAAKPDGKYLVSLMGGPKDIGAGVCGYGAQGSDNAGTYTNGALMFAIPDIGRPTCNSHLNIVATPDASCQTVSIMASLDNCGPCKTGMADCTGCGTNTCSGAVPNLTKQ